MKKMNRKHNTKKWNGDPGGVSEWHSYLLLLYLNIACSDCCSNISALCVCMRIAKWGRSLTAPWWTGDKLQVSFSPSTDTSGKVYKKRFLEDKKGWISSRREDFTSRTHKIGLNPDLVSFSVYFLVLTPFHFYVVALFSSRNNLWGRALVGFYFSEPFHWLTVKLTTMDKKQQWSWLSVPAVSKQELEILLSSLSKFHLIAQTYVINKLPGLLRHMWAETLSLYGL